MNNQENTQNVSLSINSDNVADVITEDKISQTKDISEKSFKEWEEYLANVNPNVIKLGLDRVKFVAEKMNLINWPKTKIITVAGTNGKGSTCTMLSNILSTAGYSVGLYTSPHLLRFSERIMVNGLEASNDDLCEAFQAVYNAMDEEHQLTFFEFTTLAALYIFKKEECDALVLEVGLGGRLDATNILDADIAIIPSIGKDHCDRLGYTIAEIAHEKAGIIKDTTKFVITGYLDDEAYGVISKEALEHNSKIYTLGKELKINNNSTDCFDMLEPFVLNKIKVPTLPLINAPLSVLAAYLLRTNFNMDIFDDYIKIGVRDAKLSGRIEEISTNPNVIIDVAHNPPASLYLSQVLSKRKANGRFALVGMLKDKDIAHTLLNLAFQFTRIYVVSLPGERGASKDLLVEALNSIGYHSDDIVEFDDISYAYEMALAELPRNFELVVFGSFVTVQNILELEEKRKHNPNFIPKVNREPNYDELEEKK